MKVIVLGGCGTMGSSIVRSLIRAEDVEKIIIGDKNPNMSRVHESIKNSKKVSARAIDVADYTTLVKVIAGNDVIVNAVGPYYKYGLHTMRASIEAGVNYIDIMDDYDTTLAAFDLDKPAKKAGLSLCIGFGSLPGFINIIVRYAADKLDEVDDVKIYWLYTLNDTGGAGVVAHMFHALKGDVPQYLEGKLTYVPAGSGTEEVEFVEPFGKCPVYFIGHPEPITMPRYLKGVKNVIEKAGIGPIWGNQLFRDLIDHGFASDEAIIIDGKPVVSEKFIAEFIQNSTVFKKQVEEWKTEPGKTIVKGKKDGNEITYIYESSGRMAPGTGIPASICAQMLGRGEIKTKGVVAPEGCVDPKLFFKRFAESGFHFYETKIVTEEAKY
jgi:lysine 6-dehydrogenase